MNNDEIVIKYNPLGIYVSKDGRCFRGSVETSVMYDLQTINLTEISPEKSDSGYKIILEKRPS